MCAEFYGGDVWLFQQFFPFFVTGAITASGGSWNAAYVAEVVNWKSTEIKAHGVGAYLADATTAGDFTVYCWGSRLCVSSWSLLIVCFGGRWYYYAERKFRIS